MMAAAIDQAVEHCIGTGILKDFLILHRAEVKDVILTEYDEKRHEQTLIDQTRIEIATNMLNDGMSPEKVKQYAKLSDAQWAEVLKNIQLRAN